MKGKYLEGKDHNHALNLYTKMHQNFQHHNQQQQNFQKTHHFHLSQPSKEQESSDRADTRTRTKDVPSSSNDGATVELVRRPRGRPPGSKNKPKPPLIIIRQPEPGLNAYVLEIPINVDLIQSITQFSQKRNTAIVILSATGPVSNVTLSQPAVSAAAAVTFRGRFDMLSLSATVFPSSTTTLVSRVNEFYISVGGPRGEIAGGAVVGPLIAAGTVYVVAASINNPSFHRMSLAEEEEDLRSCGGSRGNNEGQSASSVVQGGGDGGLATVAAAAMGGCFVSFYSGGPPHC